MSFRGQNGVKIEYMEIDTNISISLKTIFRGVLYMYSYIKIDISRTVRSAIESLICAFNACMRLFSFHSGSKRGQLFLHLNFNPLFCSIKLRIFKEVNVNIGCSLFLLIKNLSCIDRPHVQLITSQLLYFTTHSLSIS